MPDIGLRIGGDNPSEPADMERALGFKLPGFVSGRAKQRLMLRDITRPEIGAHILKAATHKQESLL